MADVLLTHSYHLPFDSKQSKKMQPYLPLGTLYAATALRSHGMTVAAFDAMLRDPELEFHNALLRAEPRIVVVYEDDFNFLSKMCLTRMREVAWLMAKQAKALGAITIVHGSDSTDQPELFLANQFDYVLCGEAEASLTELCSAILDGREVPELDGLVRRDGSDGTLRGRRKLARNSAWARISLPARDLVDLEPYRAAWHEAHGYFSTNLVASRGCPFRCNWCAKPISGDRFQQREESAVAEEMLLLKGFGAQHLWFSDDVFALNRHWVAEFAREVTQRNASIPFKVQTRADLMHEDTVKNLKLAGCAEAWMGVESGSQAVLDAMDKGITLHQVAQARAHLKAAGIRACFFLQFGYPGETWKELQQTIELIRSLRPDDIGISFSYPLPGTKFFDLVQAQLGAKRNWNDSDDLCIMFKGAYTTDFYRAVREALHAEVRSWTMQAGDEDIDLQVRRLWQIVDYMEPHSRLEGATQIPQAIPLSSPAGFFPLEQLSLANNA